MTGLLKDVMTERADRLDSPAIDLEAITRTEPPVIRQCAAVSTSSEEIAAPEQSSPRLVSTRKVEARTPSTWRDFVPPITA